MQEINIQINNENYKILSNYSIYGYHSHDEIVNSALEFFDKSHKIKSLVESAILYQEEYLTDTDLQNLTEAALYDFKEQYQKTNPTLEQ